MFMPLNRFITIISINNSNNKQFEFNFCKFSKIAKINFNLKTHNSGVLIFGTKNCDKNFKENCLNFVFFIRFYDFLTTRRKKHIICIFKFFKIFFCFQKFWGESIENLFIGSYIQHVNIIAHKFVKIINEQMLLIILLI